MVVEVDETVERLRSEEWGRVVAAAARTCRDLDLAEDCVQDAFVQALRKWHQDGVPRNPGAWLTRVACRRALELKRRESVERSKLPLLVEPGSIGAQSEAGEADPFREMPDDVLRLMFTCCHPALSTDARVALTLRLVCGLESDAIARSFLVTRTTMQARITRAKKKIRQAAIPYRIPRRQDLPGRLGAVLDTIHLLYTAGHTVGSGPDLVDVNLTGRAVRLARLVHELLPDESEAAGLLALVLLAEARAPARMLVGEFAPLAEQDRSRWNAELVAQGVALTRRALRSGPPDRFALMAAIAAVHTEAPSWEKTDFAEIVALYDLLLWRWPSPIIELNRAVAIGFRDGPRAALPLLARLRETEPSVAAYPYLMAALSRFQRDIGDIAEARSSLTQAITLSDNDVERKYLRRQLDRLR